MSSGTSFPAMLRSMQDNWASCMRSMQDIQRQRSFTQRQQLQTVLQEFARLTRELAATREALATLETQAGVAPAPHAAQQEFARLTRELAATREALATLETQAGVAPAPHAAQQEFARLTRELAATREALATLETQAGVAPAPHAAQQPAAVEPASAASGVEQTVMCAAVARARLLPRRLMSSAIMLASHPKMVVFTCGHCSESVQKPKVEKHYMTKCRNNNPNLSCMDCFKDFYGNDYEAHTKCITEAERYSGKGFVAKQPVGEQKQNTWVEMIKDVISENPNAPKSVIKIIESENKKSKKRKFTNESENADETDARKKKKKSEEDSELDASHIVLNQTVEIQEKKDSTKFNWHEIIITLLKSKDNEMSMKKLQKMVLAEYVTVTGEDVNDRIAEKLLKKIKSASNVTIEKNKVVLTA